MSPTPNVIEQLTRAKLLHNFVIEAHPRGKFVGDLRNRLFVALCDLVLEHHCAIIRLIDNGQEYGSALTLLRPLIETALRAFWTLYCAEDNRLVAIVSGSEQFPAFEKCRSSVESHFASQHHPGIFDIPTAYVSQLHGLTHTGIEALQFRFDTNFDISPTYPDRVLCTALQQGAMFLTMTAISHVQMVEGAEPTLEPARGRMSDKYLELFGPIT